MIHVLHPSCPPMQPSPWDDASDNTDSSAAPVPIQIGTTAPAENQPAFGEQPMLVGATAQPFQYAQQPLMISQQPSSSAKIIGVFVVIFAVLGMMGELGSYLTPGASSAPISLILISIFTLILNGVMIAGGVMMVNYQRRGLMLTLCVVAALAVLQVAALQIAVDYDTMYENGDITEEEYEFLTDDNVGDAVSIVGSIFVVLCNGVCLGLVAIPLMVSNNGLDDSKLFG